jgi:predicted neuraminidase
MFNKFLILLCLCFAGSKMDAVLREDIVLSERFLSPDWEKYDCHSSSIVQAENKELIFVWKGGFGEGKSNLDIASKVGIWQVRFDGECWSAIDKIHFEHDTVVWNPVFGKLASGELLLFYRAGEWPWASVAFMKRSLDEGRHWSSPDVLPAGIVGPSKNKPILLKDGTLLCPSSMQAGSPDGVYRSTAAWIDISKDGGRTWSKSSPMVIPGQPFGAIEPALFFDQEGNLRVLCRDRARKVGGVEGAIWTAVSKDGGMTWSALEKTSLPNPDCGFDAVDLGEGHIVLFYNHSSLERFPLSIAISKDGGRTWEKKCDLEEKTGEMPAAIQAVDGMLHVTYAYEVGSGQRRIKYVVIDPSKLFND